MLSINSDIELSSVLGANIGQLHALARNINKFIKHMELIDCKKPGKSRPIVAATGRLYQIQQSILDKVLLNRLIPSKYSYGVKGKNIKDNALAHHTNRFLLTVDISNCFPSITKDHLLETLRKVGISGSALSLIINLCTFENELKQGFSTSPILADGVLTKVDYRIGQCALQMGVKFTRYVDDLNFSASFDLQPKKSGLFKIVNNALLENGLLINREKTHDTINSEEEVLITKLRSNAKGIDVSLDYLQELRDIIENMKCYAKGEILNGDYYTKGQVSGKANYVIWINPKHKREMRALMRKVNWKNAEIRGKMEGLIAYKRTRLIKAEDAK